MIVVELCRYYGDGNITKSKMSVKDDTGRVLMECEARESRYRRYKLGEVIKGVQTMCLAEGEYALSPTSEVDNPICLKVAHTPSRRVCKICGLVTRNQCKLNKVLIGYADDNVAPEARQLTDIERCRNDFMNLLYDNYGEEMKMRVINLSD